MNADVNAKESMFLHGQSQHKEGLKMKREVNVAVIISLLLWVIFLVLVTIIEILTKRWSKLFVMVCALGLSINALITHIKRGKEDSEEDEE